MEEALARYKDLSSQLSALYKPGTRYPALSAYWSTEAAEVKSKKMKKARSSRVYVLGGDSRQHSADTSAPMDTTSLADCNILEVAHVVISCLCCSL